MIEINNLFIFFKFSQERLTKRTEFIVIYQQLQNVPQIRLRFSLINMFNDTNQDWIKNDNIQKLDDRIKVLLFINQYNKQMVFRQATKFVWVLSFIHNVQNKKIFIVENRVQIGNQSILEFHIQKRTIDECNSIYQITEHHLRLISKWEISNLKKQCQKILNVIELIQLILPQQQIYMIKISEHQANIYSQIGYSLSMDSIIFNQNNEVQAE
ncbi:unnamed protein product [Paramecium sonneborni]|uniref:Uncharacterized protein n=1 Tax=Paramecium sonneborni TaxID=65129 RepID=A0A8S1RM56_9CILI|nr:unnamed protein product [Paramecium sonneborni]